MKKVLLILGALFLSLIICGALFIGVAAYRGRALDSSSKAYVDAAVPAVLASWSAEELMTRAAPELEKSTTSEQAVELFRRFSALDSLREYQGSKGEARIMYTIKNGKVVTAEYVARSLFSNGAAEIRVGLVQRDGRWQILSFFVAPQFNKLHNG